MRIVNTIVGMLTGAFLFYEVAATLACFVIWRGSNLCGLPAAMVAIPVGMVAGGIFGSRMSKRTA